MEDKHQKIIQRNYCALVRDVDLKKLIPKLLHKKVFTDIMLEPYEAITGDTQKKRDLFLHIQRRGPDAFQLLLESLLEIGDENHVALAYQLQNQPYVRTQVNLPNMHVPQNINEIINEHRELPLRHQEQTSQIDVPQNISGSAHPFTLPLEQRPQYIRRVSLETAANGMINLSSEPLTIKVRAADSFLDDFNHKVPTYRTRSKQRGVYLCINNMEFVNDLAPYRKGAEVDEENMKILFREIGFHTSVYRNQTTMDMCRIIQEFGNERKNPFLKKSDCLVVSIMSHGEEGLTKESSVVYTQDFKTIPVAWILEQFNNENCPAFQGKPKIFIFQICRGDSVSCGVRSYYHIQHDGFNRNLIRPMTDILVAYSTLPGDKAYRDVYLGTWYIQAICHVFMEHSFDTDVEGMLKMVDDRLSNLRTGEGYMQTSCYENKAFKRCYLHPKKFETHTQVCNNTL